jgi:hypothetical protein
LGFFLAARHTRRCDRSIHLRYHRFCRELTSIDLTTDTGLSHTTIEKSPRLHMMVMNKIEDVVRKDLAKRVKSTKPKSKKPKQAPSVPISCSSTGARGQL